MPFLTVDAIIGNQALVMIDVTYAQNFNKIRQKTNFVEYNYVTLLDECENCTIVSKTIPRVTGVSSEI